MQQNIFVFINAVVVIGFINAPYQANETDGTVSVEVGVIGAVGLLGREVTVVLSYSSGSAIGELCIQRR